MLEKATMQDDGPDNLQNVDMQDEVDGGMESFDSILAKMQDFPDDEQMSAQLNNMGANEQTSDNAKAQVSLYRLYKRARYFGILEYNMLGAINRYVRKYQATMNSYYRLLRRYSG